MRLYVGSQGGTCITPWGDREREILEGDRCFSAAYKYKGAAGDYPPGSKINVLLDSGAFSDSPQKRLSFDGALQRQLNFEHRFSKSMGWEFVSEAIASYDVLIDEKWSGHIRSKARWNVNEAWEAVETTIAAARFLAKQRNELAPRHLVLGCQGVDAEQYQECVKSVLEIASPSDWIGLGGWCILGFPKYRHWLSEFCTMLVRCVPLIASAGIRRIHLYGCLYEPAIAPFARICQEHGLDASTDSARPIWECKKLDAKSVKKAGVRKLYWRDNVQWWRDYVAQIERSPYFKMPEVQPRQLLFL